MNGSSPPPARNDMEQFGNSVDEEVDLDASIEDMDGEDEEDEDDE